MSLIETWDKESYSGSYTAEQFTVRLTLESTDRIHKLKEKYPHFSLNKIINDLISFGLNSVET